MNKIKIRRIRKKARENKIKILFIIIILVILSLSTGYAAQTTLLKVNGSATIAEENTCDYNVSASYTLNNTWGGANNSTNYHISLIIKNESSEDIVDWTIKIKGPNDMEIQVNAYVTTEDGLLTLTPYSWNSKISAMGELKLDFNIITVEENFEPTYILFNDCKVYGSGTVDKNPTDTDTSDELTKIELSPSEYTMAVNETLTLNTTTTPSNSTQKIEYKSSDETVATVNQNGEITALKEGTTTITASYQNISSTSKITVVKEEESEVSPSGIDVVFASTAYWGDTTNGYTMQYTITITNNTSNNINNCSFVLNLPTGTTYLVWTSSVTVTDNNFVYGYTINSNENVVIYGQLSLPAGYNINNYLNPTITKIQVS